MTIFKLMPCAGGCGTMIPRRGRKLRCPECADKLRLDQQRLYDQRRRKAKRNKVATDAP